MQNKFIYRAFRLRRAILLGGLLPLVPLLICSTLPFFNGSIDLTVLFTCWAANTGFVGVLMTWFPGAWSEVLRLTWSYTIAIFVVIGLAVLMQAEGRNLNNNVLIGFAVGWSLCTLIIFFVILGSFNICVNAG